MNLKKSLMLCDRFANAGWLFQAPPQKIVKTSALASTGPPLYCSCGFVVCAIGANFSFFRWSRRILRMLFLVHQVLLSALISDRRCVHQPSRSSGKWWAIIHSWERRRPLGHSAPEGSWGGRGRTSPSLGAGMLLPLLPTRSGSGLAFGPAQGAGGIGLGVGLGGGGWTILLPNAGGLGRRSVASARPASEGASSTRGTPNRSSPKRSMTVLERLACECHSDSIPCFTVPPNMINGMREPPIA